MKISNLPRLRSLMKKLYAAPITWTDPYVSATAGQEALDFVAMAAGLKPVYVTGRGFDEPLWSDTLLEVAQTGGFHVVAGPYWQAVPPDKSLPEWFTAPSRKRLTAGQAFYVAKRRSVAAERAALASGVQPTVEQEARFMGFPECCVSAHYETARALERASFEMIEKRAGGEELEMRRLADGDEPVLPEPDDERTRLAKALQVRPAPYTSLNMCADCAAEPQSPGQTLSAHYATLARALAGSPRRSR